MADDRSPLPRRPYPLVLPPSDGFESAVRRGRRMRHRRAAGVGGAAMTLVAGTLGVTLMRPDADHLEPTRVPERPVKPVVPASPDPLLPSRAPITSVVPAASPTAVAPAPSRSATTVATQPKPSMKPRTTVKVKPEPTVAPPVRKPAVSRVTQDADTTCLVGDDESGWCDRAYASKVDAKIVLEFRICPVYDATLGPATLHFTTEQEVDFEVRNKAGQTVWTWSLGQTFDPRDERFEVARDQCVIWRTDWTKIGENGADLPKGDYTLYARTVADGHEDREPADYSFTI